jgi:hypothetical protein
LNQPNNFCAPCAVRVNPDVGFRVAKAANNAILPIKAKKAVVG